LEAKCWYSRSGTFQEARATAASSGSLCEDAPGDGHLARDGSAQEWELVVRAGGNAGRADGLRAELDSGRQPVEERAPPGRRPAE
jgi:hypothetical protein